MKTSRKTVGILSLSAALLVSGVAAQAQQQQLWNGGGATVTGPGLDGPGVWDYSTPNWFPYNPPSVPWSSNNIAVFGAGGAAGTVTVSAPIALSGIYFYPVGSGSYDLAADGSNDPLIFTGGKYNSALQISSGVSASIDCPIIGDYSMNAGGGTLTINANTAMANTGVVLLNSGNLIANGGTTGNSAAGDVTLNNGATLTLNDNLGGAGHESVSNAIVQGGTLISAPTGGSLYNLIGYTMNFVPGGTNSFGLLQIDNDLTMSYQTLNFILDLSTTSSTTGAAGANSANDYVNFAGNISGPLNNMSFILNFIGAQPADGTQMTYTVLNYNGPLPSTTPHVTVAGGAGVSSALFNTNSNPYTITVTFGTPAAIAASCPANITTADDGSGTGAIVTFQPTASGGCSTPTVVSVPSSGSRFPIGTTTVNVTAFDTCGSTNTCSFTVTVTGSAGQPVITSIVNNGDGSATLTYNATGGNMYDVQYATSLTSPVQWTTIPAGNTTPVNSGPVSFTDPNTSSTASGAGGQIFYRIATP